MKNGKKKSSAHFDDIFGHLGECGRYQIWQYFLLCLCGIPVAFHIYLNTFTFAIPRHRCRLDAIPGDTFDINMTSPKGVWVEKLIPKAQGRKGLDSCHFYNHSGVFPNITVEANASASSCHAWVIDETDFPDNVVTRLDLFCDKDDYVTFADSLIFVGILIGSFFFGDISDRFGRHRALMLSIVGALGAGVGTAYMKTYWGIVTFRTVSVFFTQGMFMCAFVLGLEMMGPRARTYAGIVIEFFFAGGAMILACLAYYIRDWVWLQLAASIPIALFVLFFFLIDESPRWLLVKGKMKRFEKVLEKMCKSNRKSVPADVVSQLEDAAYETKAQKRSSGSFIDVFRFPNVALKSLNLFFGWMVSTMLYYGITMNMTALPESPFLLVVISGGVEMPGYLLCLLLLNRLGRRIMLSASMILAGISCFLCPFFLDDMVVTSLAISGKFFISIAFAVIFIFTAELYPTCIRTTGIGLSSLGGRIGGILFPIIIQYFEDRNQPGIPLLIFGISSLTAGVFAAFLPETLNMVLPETLEEAELFGRPRCCGGNVGGGGGGRGREGAPLLAGGAGSVSQRPDEGRSLLSDDDEEDDELFSTNAMT